MCARPQLLWQLSVMNLINPRSESITQKLATPASALFCWQSIKEEARRTQEAVHPLPGYDLGIVTLRPLGKATAKLRSGNVHSVTS
jgi:hypothetical protein